MCIDLHSDGRVVKMADGITIFQWKLKLSLDCPKFAVNLGVSIKILSYENSYLLLTSYT